MKFLNVIFLTLLLFFSFSLSGLLLADDAAGFVRVSVESNAEVVVDMPFVPFGNATPGAFLSGPFAGDGSSGSDALYVLPSSGLTYTNAVYSSGDGWLDPASGDATGMTAAQGDTLVFAPGYLVGVKIMELCNCGIMEMRDCEIGGMDRNAIHCYINGLRHPPGCRTAANYTINF